MEMSYKNYTHPSQARFVIKEHVKFQQEEVKVEIDLLKMAQYMTALRRSYSEPFGYRRYEVKTIK